MGSKMKVVALISGGKDSCYNMMQCIAAGHEIVALANLQPATDGETDSYMYQTVGHDGIHLYSEAMGLPLFRRVISGGAVTVEKEYSPTDGDEVEDLFLLLSDIKKTIHFDAVSVGAILSDYQRIRVENVCIRLGCVSLAYLWRRDQCELLQEMIDANISAIVIKTASLGLDPDIHLGQSLSEMQSHLLESKTKYGINVCGEGGEYESFTLDCPLFQQSIIIDECEKVIHSDDAFAPVGYLRLKKMHLVPKTASELKGTSSDECYILENSLLKTPLHFVSDISTCNLNEANSAVIDDDARLRLALENAVDSESESVTHAMDSTKQPTPLEEVPKNSILDANAQSLKDTLFSNFDYSLPSPSNVPRVSQCKAGWLWIMGVEGKADANQSGDNSDAHTTSVQKTFINNNIQNSKNGPVKQALEAIRSILEERGGKLQDLIAVTLYIRDMDNYANYNAQYNTFFSSQPPVRICVEAPLPSHTGILMEALAFLPQSFNSSDTSSDCGDITSYDRHCMHVQGISHWAPANIGPYSQAVWVGDVIYVAGQIGLVPGSMTLVEGGVRVQCKLALRHINRIVKAVDSKVELRDVVQGICFVTDYSFIEECRQEWEKRTNNAIVEYLVVTRLPRDASVEWQVWAHKHNTAFEYEETGCYIEKVKVSIIRRWNYENRVAAIVCRASLTDDSDPVNLEEIYMTAEYALSKLFQDAETKTDCSLRVFYRVGVLNPTHVVEAVDKIAEKYSFTFSILPVCALRQRDTVLCFCAVRHQ